MLAAFMSVQWLVVPITAWYFTHLACLQFVKVA